MAKYSEYRFHYITINTTMKKLNCALLAGALIAGLLSSCSAPKKVPYFSKAETIPENILSTPQPPAEPVFTVGDLLNIQVSGINMNAMAPFNKGQYVDAEGNITSMMNNNNVGGGGSESSTQYYLVNTDGCIDFPIVGKIKVAGLTKSQLAEEICNAIYPKYVTEKPTVDIRLMNFRVIVGGAVNSPGIYQSKNERMTFIEAITMAGDLNIKGERQNILLYRTNPDGTREVHRLDIHDKNFLLSPYYTLQQNDYIYVEPNSSMRSGSWQLNPAVGATLTIFGGITSVATFVISIVNLTKK